MYNVLLILLNCYVQSSQTEVYQQFHGITWNGARDECKPFGLENRNDYLQGSVISDEQEFWIGMAIYRELTPWIEIIGCFEIWKTDDHPFYSVPSIGMCKQKCDSKNMGYNFGYRKTDHNNCVCQPIYINQSYRKPIKSCVSAVNFFVYQEYTGIVNMSSDPGHCTTICCGSCNKPTQNRNRLEGRRCSTEDNKIVGRCEKQVHKWGVDYVRSMTFCNNNNKLLPSPNYCQGEGRDSGQMSWTNVFREEIEIMKLKDVNEDPIRCFSGVFSLVNGQRILNVSDHMCSEHKNWFICKTNSSVTEIIIQSTYSTLKISKDKAKSFSTGQPFTTANGNKSLHTQGPINTDTITRSWLFTLKMSKIAQTHTSSDQLKSSSSNKTSLTARKIFRKTDFKNYQKYNEDKSKSIGAMIGGILSACCILFVSAVLIVCKIRSKGIFKETTKSVKEGTNQKYFSNTIYQDYNNSSDKTSAWPTSNQTYGLDGASTPVYAEVNKSKKLENPDETYTDAGYGEYDHLHDIQNRKICPQENIYDSHGAPRNKEDQTYDSSDFGKGKLNEGNHLYDHSFSVVEGDYMSIGNNDSQNSNNASIYNKAS